MKKLILLGFVLCIYYSNAQTETSPAVGNTNFMIAGHTTVTAVMDSSQNDFRDANFSAIFLYKLADDLFIESEIEIETGGGSPDIGLEHANLVWMISDNIAFHAGRFVPHFGLYRGRLGEGFINRFASDPIGFGDGGIGTMQAVGFGFQGGLPLGPSKMNYDLWVSDGPQLLTDAENAGQFEYEAYTDNNKNKAIGGRIGFLPLSNSSLEVGLSYENAAKTGDKYSIAQNVGVNMLAVDANFYHAIDPIKSTLRITGEYKKQDVDNFNYSLVGDSLLSNPTFKNSSYAYYASASLRPSGSDNNILRNLELAFRYSQFKTPDGAPWAYYDPVTGSNIKVSRTAIALDYWLKWNCVLKAVYEKETISSQNVIPNRFYVQMYYGF